MMNKVMIFVIAGLLALSLGLHLLQFLNKEELVYVSVVEVFNEFEMKKELEKDFTAVTEQRKLILDSLKFQFNQQLAIGEQQVLESLKREIIYKEKQFAESDMALVEKSNQEILQQLNVYMKEFGEKNSYKVILGAQGDGGLIYAKPDKDITKEMLAYVNMRYQGK